MEFEITQLAQTLTHFLSPALPHLLDVGKKVAEDAGKKLTAAAVEKAKALWSRLGSAVRGRPAAAEAAADVAAAPHDEDARAAFRLQLRKILAEDEDLAKELAGMLAEWGGSAGYHAEVGRDGVIAQGPGAVAGGSVAVSGDVRGDVVVGAKES